MSPGDETPATSFPVPDLLYARERVRIDADALRQTLVFAFAASAPAELFDDAVARAALPEAAWQATDFARDLYVAQLARTSFEPRIAGKGHTSAARYVERVLASPPSASADVDARRAVLREIVDTPELRSELEAVVEDVLRLRALLSAPRQPAPRVRRMEILRAVQGAFARLARSFASARSPLARLRAFGAAVVASPGYERLVSLLEHDEHQAALDLRVRIGADGEVRAMQVLAIRENAANPYYVSALRRWFARLRLWLRGYRASAGEVAERLLSDALTGVEAPVVLLFQVLGDASVFLGAASFRDRAIAAGLAVSLPEETTDGSVALEALFNPHLLAAGVVPVPSDLRTGPRAVVLVTGPNSGGKTRLLQSVAIAQLLADGGLFVPARTARLPRATGLFASLFEEPSADQPEGHLGMELLRVRKLFDDLGAGALVVLDELCSGTNPSEGEEIARLVLSLLPDLGVRAFVTTHLLSFAAALAREAPSPAMEFLQVELDATEEPTFRFAPGVAKTSLAHRTAERLGVTRGELLERIAAKRSRSSR